MRSILMRFERDPKGKIMRVVGVSVGREEPTERNRE